MRLGEIYAGSRHLATYNMGYDEDGSQSVPLNTYFIHTDWLGTERTGQPNRRRHVLRISVHQSLLREKTMPHSFFPDVVISELHESA